ncbi:MAG: SMP-30/gluconolactonase/LRE family protein [Roseibium sp.]|uniref:SMP-30/gluconolactonase/LRE family protein n=1 Tax=Roseibium sp. TaxID=1936156 RepID=UPI00262ECD71|nr:SMP-30/gluconolactonase/LRE family protein [Roseibium sp.]MCV0424157.1 SMP-30/gluconolactonase/LRE family protein [Roseibium sp.]
MSSLDLEPPKVEIAVQTDNTLGESPVWHEEEQTLYWIDLRAPSIQRYRPANGMHQSFRLQHLVGAVVPRSSGGVISCMENGLHVFRFDGQGARPLPGINLHIPQNHRMNDACCDRYGNLWCSVMRDFGKSATGTLYRLSPDDSVILVRSGLTVPNGLCHDIVSDHLYFTDSPSGKIEFIKASEPLQQPVDWTPFCDLSSLPGVPDGATVDREGFLWSAVFGAGKVLRISPDGEVVGAIHLPVSQPTSCTFGGSNLRTLFVTTARQGLAQEQLRNEPLAGSVLKIELPYTGQREGKFAA